MKKPFKVIVTMSNSEPARPEPALEMTLDADHWMDAWKSAMHELGLDDAEVAKVTCRVNTDASKHLPDHACCGGITVTACHGRIVCDNTLDARIQLCYEELLPQIRHELWDKHGDPAAK